MADAAEAGYTPSAEVARILEWARERIQRLPYPVTARWAFYQLVQKQGFGKASYRLFLKWSSRARKAFWREWSPTSFVDDTRGIDGRGGGYATADEWIASFYRQPCTLSVQQRQRVVLLVLYEASAMSSQFDYHLEPLRVASAPFRGDASIRHKWEIAARIERLHAMYPDKPVVVLYFGDHDLKGREIPRSALRDIWEWVGSTGAVPDDGGPDPPFGSVLAERRNSVREEWRAPGGMFRWIRVGLDERHVRRYGLPENPERPGTYQWEALDEEQAGELILDAVREFWDEAVVREVERDEREAERRWRGLVGGVPGVAS